MTTIEAPTPTRLGRFLFRIIGTLAMPIIILGGCVKGIYEALRIWWGCMRAEDVAVYLESRRRK